MGQRVHVHRRFKRDRSHAVPCRTLATSLARGKLGLIKPMPRTNSLRHRLPGMVQAPPSAWGVEPAPCSYDIMCRLCHLSVLIVRAAAGLGLLSWYMVWLCSSAAVRHTGPPFCLQLTAWTPYMIMHGASLADGAAFLPFVL